MGAPSPLTHLPLILALPKSPPHPRQGGKRLFYNNSNKNNTINAKKIPFASPSLAPAAPLALLPQSQGPAGLSHPPAHFPSAHFYSNVVYLVK